MALGGRATARSSSARSVAGRRGPLPDAVTEALADGGLDRLARRTWPDGRAPSLRWIVVHMIEEYARHNGHADLIRESVDESSRRVVPATTQGRATAMRLPGP